MDRANRIEIFKSMMQCLDDPEIPEKLEEWGFFDAPASTKYHGNYKGGLLTILSQLPKLSLTLPKRTVSFGSSNAHRGLSGCFTTSAKSTNTVIPSREELLTAISIALSTMSKLGSTTPKRSSKVTEINRLCVVLLCSN